MGPAGGGSGWTSAAGGTTTPPEPAFREDVEPRSPESASPSDPGGPAEPGFDSEFDFDFDSEGPDRGPRASGFVAGLGEAGSADAGPNASEGVEEEPGPPSTAVDPGAAPETSSNHTNSIASGSGDGLGSGRSGNDNSASPSSPWAATDASHAPARPRPRRSTDAA